MGSKKCVTWFSILAILFIPPLFAKEKMIFSLDLIRHGDRAPIAPIPNALYTGKTPLGHLTPEGIAQTHLLGIKLREKYVHQWGLLPAYYDSKKIYVRSTDTDRTIISAQTIVLGLYPMGTGPKVNEAQFALPEGLQPVAIHTESIAKDALLLCQNQKDKISRLGHKYMANHPTWQKKQAKLAKEMLSLKEATGYKIEGLYSIGRLADSIMIYEKHGIALPPQLTQSQIQKMPALRDWIYLTVWQYYPIAASLGHPLLETVLIYLKNSDSQKSPLKYVLFSAHDSSIVLTAGALKAALPTFPGYASQLNFSLMEDEYKQRKVHVYYNEKPLFIPGCQGHICTLNQLEELVSLAKEASDPIADCECNLPEVL